jgi:hypothetical protein
MKWWEEIHLTPEEAKAIDQAIKDGSAKPKFEPLELPEYKGQKMNDYAEALDNLKNVCSEKELKEQFAINTYGSHELSDRASIVLSMWYDFILDHPSCVLHEELYNLANTIGDSVAEFYQKAAAKDIGYDNGTTES